MNHCATTVLILLTMSPSSSSDEGICLTPKCRETATLINSYMNTSVDPCEDFYLYACGNFDSRALNGVFTRGDFLDVGLTDLFKSLQKLFNNFHVMSKYKSETMKRLEREVRECEHVGCFFKNLIPIFHRNDVASLRLYLDNVSEEKKDTLATIADLMQRKARELESDWPPPVMRRDLEEMLSSMRVEIAIPSAFTSDEWLDIIHNDTSDENSALSDAERLINLPPLGPTFPKRQWISWLHPVVRRHYYNVRKYHNVH